MATFDTFYINGENLSKATAVFTDATMTTLAAQAIFGDGGSIRTQVPSGEQVLFADQIHLCDACTTDCNEQITFSQSFATAASMQGSVNFGVQQGAIKVTISGVGERPVGVDLEMNGNRYNFFSSTHPAATAQRNNAPNLTQKSYFWSVNGVGFCNNWTSGSANLDILYYNSISGLWEDSEEDILNQSLANKMTSGFPGIGGLSVGSTAGNLVTYIPSAGNTNINLNIIFETPCGPSQGTNKGQITGPLLSVECPTLLTIVPTTTVQNDPLTACSQPDNTVTNLRYHGPVRGTTNGVLQNGDFLYTSNTGAAFVADGYYKTLGSYLEGISSSVNGSFRVQNGVVKEIQSCP